MSLSPLLDDSALGLRLGHLLLSTVGSLVFYAFCLRWLTPGGALASLFALQLMPFWLPFGVVATPTVRCSSSGVWHCSASRRRSREAESGSGSPPGWPPGSPS
jgi:hypothetical protein